MMFGCLYSRAASTLRVRSGRRVWSVALHLLDFLNGLVGRYSQFRLCHYLCKVEWQGANVIEGRMFRRRWKVVEGGKASRRSRI